MNQQVEDIRERLKTKTENEARKEGMRDKDQRRLTMVKSQEQNQEGEQFFGRQGGLRENTILDNQANRKEMRMR